MHLDKIYIQRVPALMMRLGAAVQLFVKVLPNQVDAEYCHCRTEPGKPVWDQLQLIGEEGKSMHM